ncbi:response regulator [Vogesella indigofera]|uniref:response regulator n=1 Tax=Vogesella indigofera TaxID=45465 RepID=UPI003F4444B9
MISSSPALTVAPGAAPAMLHVLVVDDDEDIRSLICQYLHGYAMSCVGVGDGRAMREAMASRPFDVIVLDLMLPGESGLTLCKEIRSQSAVPILMISAHGEPIERIISLEVGADDFVSKPFDIRELVARIHSVLRRTQAGRQPAAGHGSDKPPRQIQFGDWRLNVGLRQLQDKQGVVIPLSNAEFRLLSVLLQRPRTILDRELLLDLTRGCTVDAFDRSIDILISRLRHKLQDDPRNPRLIRTVRGEGYILDAATSCL